MAHTGELDQKHHDLIDAELNKKIAALKTKLTVKDQTVE